MHYSQTEVNISDRSYIIFLIQNLVLLLKYYSTYNLLLLGTELGFFWKKSSSRGVEENGEMGGKAGRNDKIILKSIANS